MNEARRNKLEEILEQLEEIIVEEQDAFDNRPEQFQDTEDGEKSQDAISVLESAKDEIESLIYE